MGLFGQNEEWIDGRISALERGFHAMGSNGMSYQPFNTYANMLAAGLKNGERAAVTRDPDPKKNGLYVALRSPSLAPKDFIKEPNRFEIKNWAPKMKYLEKDLIYDQLLRKLYIAKNNFTSDLVEIDEDLKLGNIKSVGGSGLRGEPVKSVSELKAILAKDFELRQIKGTNPGDPDKDYIFKHAASGIKDAITDTAKTGQWILQTTPEPPVSFVYTYDDMAGTTPADGHIMLNDKDEDKVSFVYVNKKNKSGQDMSKFLSALDTGSSISILDDAIRNHNYSYSVTGPATLVGNSFKVPVDYVKSSSNGTIPDQTDVDVEIAKEVVETLRLNPVANELALKAIDAKDYMIATTLSDDKEFVFKHGVFIDGIKDDANTGVWREIKVADDLRKSPIANEAELVALDPKDFTLIQTLDNGKNFVFKRGVTVGGIINTDGTGVWIEVHRANNLRMKPVANELALIDIDSPKDFTITKTSDNGKVFTFNFGVHIDGISDKLGTGVWREVLVADDLRKNPVANELAMIKIEAKDYMMVQTLDDGKEFVFKFGVHTDGIEDLAKTGVWKEVEDGGLRRSPVANEAEMVKLKAKDFALIQTLDDEKEFVFKLGVHVDGIEDLAKTGVWREVQQSDGLRHSPVTDEAAMTALEAKDYMLLQTLDDGKEFVFKLGTHIGGIPDDLATGVWIEQNNHVTSEIYHKTVTVAGENNFTPPFKLENPVVFRNGIIAEADTYQLNPAGTGIITNGEPIRTTITIINVQSFADTNRYETIVRTANKKDFDIGNIYEVDSLIVFHDGILVDDHNYHPHATKASFITFEAGITLSVNSTITIIYKRKK